ncbi:MAG: molybdenum cofactor biosynthesis protein MoeB [Alphaproteobacteria bacterium PRO2]|jgi:molybdopterin/thiamine biosynthesis adenylyltransferase/rhodanese-related sulfurtransferase|nr:molybdenum cofactor biosynthesis protein MoeB [Alphaproteobacteria bacterium PRO2]
MTKNSRYDRQTVLPEIGAEGQKKLSFASVLCIGAGGLGCPALLYLTAAGVGRIGIVDFDTVDETNLQRQVLFTMDQLGRNKAEAAKKQLKALNPEISIEANPVELTDKNAESLFKNYDVIIDGTDNFAAKFLINDAAVKCRKPFIYGSILGFDGQLSVFGAEGGPCYRCLFPEVPKGHVPNCAEAGVIGAVAGIIGAAQAMEAIKIIIGHESFRPLTGKVWIVDLRTLENRLLLLTKNPDCPVCSKSRKDIHLQYSSPVCGFIPEVTPEQVQQNKTALIIDVREREEWDAGHIESAQHVPLSALAQGDIPELPPDCDIILHCQKGKRGLQAAQILRAQGYLNVSNMAGGYEAWLKCS